MGETASQLKQEIEEQREGLGENLQRLESKVKRTTDWRTQFDERPMLMIGAAFGGGLLLSSLTGGGKGREEQETRRSDARTMMQSSPRSPERNEITETIDNIRGALMGLAARELRTFMATAVPGFEQEYRETTNRRGASSATRLEESDREMSTAPRFEGADQERPSATMT